MYFSIKSAPKSKLNLYLHVSCSLGVGIIAAGNNQIRYSAFFFWLAESHIFFAVEINSF